MIPRGPNLDESTTGEIPFVAAPIEEETQATLFDSTVAPADSAVSSSTNGSVLTDVLDADAHVASGVALAGEVPPITERKTITVPEVKAQPTSEPLHSSSPAASESAQGSSFVAANEPQSAQRAPFDFSQVYAGAHTPRHAASTEAASEPSQEQGTEPLPATVLSSAAARARRRARNLR